LPAFGHPSSGGYTFSEASGARVTAGLVMNKN
jgi:predicted dienelactone hydrolase